VRAMQFVRTTVVLVFLALPVSSGQAEVGGAWSQWGGPAGDNLSPETGLLKEWPDGGPRLLWTASGCGKGYSTVSIADGMIYTSGKVGEETIVLAFDLDGRLQWKATNGASWSAPANMRWATEYDGARATPTVSDGLVYHLNETGRLAAFDAKTGKEAWSHNILDTFDAELPKYGYAESVLIDGNNLICYPGGTKGYMVALEKKTGEIVWANRDIGDPAAYCSARVVEVAGVRQVLTMTAQAVIGVRAETGELLWRHEHTNRTRVNAVTPVRQGGHVYATTGYGKGGVLLKLSKDGGRFRAEKVWENELLDSQHGGVVLLDGHLFGSGHNQRGWFSLEFATGRELYRDKGVGQGSLTYADGMLYCLGETGTMALVPATPAAYKVVSQFQVPMGGEGRYWAHPVVYGGRLYLRHGDKLHAYDIRGR